jgi:hypothetical protein
MTVLSMNERIAVPFEAEGAGVGELTWGQHHIWGAMAALGEPMNMCAVRPLPAGATVDEFVDELRFYLCRYQSMRTLVQTEPNGRPRQVVLARGEAYLSIVDTDGSANPAEAAAALYAREERIPFEHARELPIRMTLVRHRGQLTHLVATLSHLATDRGGGLAMYNDLVNRDPRTGTLATPVAMDPLRLAAWQATPAAKRQTDAALAYWERTIRTLPTRRFGDPGTGSGFWRLEVTSRPLWLAAQLLANRTGVGSAAPLLALYAVAVAQLTASSPAVIQMLVSNRFRPGLADIVSNVSQSGLCPVDVAGVTVDEAVVRAWRASIVACKHAYFDLTAWKSLLARLAAERDGQVDLGCYYNDRSSHQPDPAGPPSPQQVRAAAALAPSPRWTALDFFNEKLMLTVDDAPGAVVLTVSADTRYVSRSGMLDLVARMEAIAVSAAVDPGTATGVTATPVGNP